MKEETSWSEDNENMSVRSGMSCSVHVQQYSGELECVLLTILRFSDLVLTAGACRRLFWCTMCIPPSSSFGTQTTGHAGFNAFPLLGQLQSCVCHARGAGTGYGTTTRISLSDQLGNFMCLAKPFCCASQFCGKSPNY